MSRNHVALVLYDGCDAPLVMTASDILSALRGVRLHLVAEAADRPISDGHALTLLSSHAFDAVEPDVVFVPAPTTPDAHVPVEVERFVSAHPNADVVRGDGFSLTVERCLDVVEARSGRRRAREAALAIEYDPLPPPGR